MSVPSHLRTSQNTQRSRDGVHTSTMVVRKTVKQRIGKNRLEDDEEKRVVGYSSWSSTELDMTEHA